MRIYRILSRQSSVGLFFVIVRVLVFVRDILIIDGVGGGDDFMNSGHSHWHWLQPGMRIVSLNVNGLRSIREHYQLCRGWTFDDFLASFKADLICFQESKINDVARLEHEFALPRDYVAYYTFQRGAKKIGYSGVVTFCRKAAWEPAAYEEGLTGMLTETGRTVGRIGSNDHLLDTYDTLTLRTLDSEGRCVITLHSLARDDDRLSKGGSDQSADQAGQGPLDRNDNNPDPNARPFRENVSSSKDGQFVLINVYFPNDSGPDRDDYRIKFYNVAWKRCLDLLRRGQSIILLGDINVTYHPMDHCDFARPFAEMVQRLGWDEANAAIKEYFTNANSAVLNVKDRLIFDAFYGEKPLRGWLYKLLVLDEEARRWGLHDVFRHFHPEQQARYTCWNTLVGARGTNQGTRIDLILAAGPLFAQANKRIIGCDIWPDFMGSDHCPVYVDLALEPDPTLSSFAPPRNLKAHSKQKRLSDYFVSANKGALEAPDASNVSHPPKKTRKLTEFFPRVNKEEALNENGSPLVDAEGRKLEEDVEIDRVEETQNRDVIQSHPDVQDYPDIRDNSIIGADIETCTKGEVDTAEDSATLTRPSEWKEIFNKPRPVPECRGHGEPCKLLTVSKRGPNRGRHFYACARGPAPIGDPSGRCDHFEWANSANKKS